MSSQVFNFNTSLASVAEPSRRRKSLFCVRTRSEMQPGPVRMEVFESIHDIWEHWEQVVPKENTIMGADFLSALERSPLEGVTFYYLVYYEAEQPIGVAYFQYGQFTGDRSFYFEPNNRWSDRIRSFVQQRLRLNVLFNGNLLSSGNHGHYFNSLHVSPSRAATLLQSGIEKVTDIIEDSGRKVTLTFAKDFYDPKADVPSTFRENKYYEYEVQPDMRMQIPVEWQNFEDYMKVLTSKYRVRVRRARKKLGAIEKRELDYEWIVTHGDEMYDLHQKVVEKSGFNLVHLQRNYFKELKSILGHNTSIYGYFLEGKLVAFFTAIKNGPSLEAHILGFESALNPSHQIYLNVLYDLLELGIGYNAENIHYARTALEIKSSVGAKAKPLYCYIKHRCAITNWILPRILGFLTPHEHWKPRNPFKA